MELVANMKQRLTSIPNEYSYFDDGRLGAWAGPKHWKFKPMARPTAGFAVPHTKAKKAKDPIGPYACEDLFDEDNTLWKSVEKTMIIPKKAIKLQANTMNNWREEK